MPIDKSQKSVQNTETRAMIDLERLSSQALTQSSHDGFLGLDLLNDTAKMMLLEAYKKRTSYLCCERESCEFLVREKNPSRTNPESVKRPGITNLPKLWRTYIVTVKDEFEQIIRNVNLNKSSKCHCLRTYV